MKNEKYYRIRPKNNPNVNGEVVRINNSSILEVFVGDSSIKEVSCTIGVKGKVTPKDGYFINKITYAEALQLKKDYTFWNLQRGWISSDVLPQDVINNTPGLRGRN